jgi:tRNA 2-thiocytidine biosynthesis protein TtcA
MDYIKMTGISKEEKYFLNTVKRTAGKAINKFSMIGEGDHVLAAISGGKDSFVMMDVLSERRKHIPIDYKITALHVNVENIGYDIDINYYEKLCASLNVEFITINTSYVDESKGGKSACYLCSLHRRKILFDYMKKNTCSKLALGHHMDDAVETLFMNMTFNGQISSMPGKLSMFNGEFDIIRPLILLRNDDIQKYAVIKYFQNQKKVCPYSDKSKRHDMKQILCDLDKLYNGGVDNIFRSMSDIKQDYLPKIG